MTSANPKFHDADFPVAGIARKENPRRLIILSLAVYSRKIQRAKEAKFRKILPKLFTAAFSAKFGLKIPNCLGKMSENASVRFGRWWTFCTHDVNWVVTLDMA